MTTRIRTLSAALLACGLAFPAAADWSIDGETSALHFLSTKNAQVTEVHKFDSFDGTLSDGGKLNVAVDLSSVNTAIDIRNKRMQEMLFNVTKFAQATFEANLPESMMNLKSGQVVNGKVDGILMLHGKAVPTSFAVKARLIAILVSSNCPSWYITPPLKPFLFTLGINLIVSSLESIRDLPRPNDPAIISYILRPIP